MKKIAFALVLVTLMLSVVAPAYAAEVDTPINADPNTLSSAEVARLREFDSQLREKFSPESYIQRGIADRITYTAPIVEHQQTTSYYCGPACVQMVYEGITGDTSHDQAWFARKLGTTTAGSYSGDIATVLKAQTGKNYSMTNVHEQDETDFYNNIANSLSCGCAVVVNVKKVPGRYTSNSGHFMVVHGSVIDTVYGLSSAYFTYTDPHHNNNYYGTFSMSVSNMFSAVSSGGGNYVRVE